MNQSEMTLILSTDAVRDGFRSLRDIYDVLCIISGNLMRIILPDGGVRTFTGGPLTIEHLLARLGINAAAVIVIRNGKIVPEDDIAIENDDIRIIRVAHGG